jgi:hypothetical protein
MCVKLRSDILSGAFAGDKESANDDPIPSKDKTMILRAPLTFGLLFTLALGAYVMADDRPQPTITLERPVHFTAPDGSDVTAASGIHQVRQAGTGRLELAGSEGNVVLTLQAQEIGHDQALTTPVATVIQTDEDVVHLVLLLPDKKALDAAGSTSGVRSRAGGFSPLTSAQVNQALIGKPLQGQVQMQLAGGPPPPVLDNPAVNAVLQNPRVRFQWRPGSGQPAPTRYEVCITETSQLCSSFNAVVFKTVEAAAAAGTAQYELGVGPAPGTSGSTQQTGTPITATHYDVTLPIRFQGKRLQWSVTACAPNTTRPAIGGRFPEGCTPSAPRLVTWTLPVPTLNAPTDNISLLTLTPSFAWNYGSQQGVDHFLVCIAKPGVSCPAQPAVQAHVFVTRVQGSLRFTPPQDVSPFMGQTLHWTVAACNAAVGCVYQQQYRRLQVPVMDGSFDAIYEVTQNAKCLNCHEMHRENDNYLRHIQLGRFTRGDVPPTAFDGYPTQKCLTCHSTATGFVDHWAAPRISFDHPISYGFCWGIKRKNIAGGSTLTQEARNHLINDSFVLWAVDRIPGLGRARWRQKLEAWFNAGAPCPCDHDPSYSISPPASCAGARRHGQFTP